MKKRYYFLAVVPLLLAVLLAVLPDKSNSIDVKRNKLHLKSALYTGITPDALLLESVTNDRFINPDELAKIIMGQDPSYLLIDIRDSIQYQKFTLPGAINIPYESLLNNENLGIINSTTYKFVLFSNGTILPDQVWMVLRRANSKNIKVLKGGLNSFYQLYLNPPLPVELDPQEAFEMYDFRKSVGMYLGLPDPELRNNSTINNTPSTPNKVEKKAPTKIVVPVKATGGGDEGC